MPVMYPTASPLRIARLRLGLPLTQMSLDLGVSVSLLSLIERKQIDRPAVAKQMREYLAESRDSRHAAGR